MTKCISHCIVLFPVKFPFYFIFYLVKALNKPQNGKKKKLLLTVIHMLLMTLKGHILLVYGKAFEMQEMCITKVQMIV